MKRDQIVLILLLILLLPLFFIRVNAFHDWGDDFAQYLIQASLLRGETESIPVSEVSPYGPKIKGLLFSFLLIPAPWLSDAQLLSSKIIVSAGLVLLALSMFLILRKSTGLIIALAATLMAAYNHQFIIIKDQVLPDFWFTGVVLLALYLYNQNTRKTAFSALIIAGLSIGFKSAGIVLCGAFIMHIMLNRNKIFYTINDKVKALMLIGIPLMLIMISEWLIGSEKPPLAWYSLVTLREIFSFGIIENFNTYLAGLKYFFEFEIPMWSNEVIWYIILIGLTGGFILKGIRKAGPMEWFTIFYIGLLLIYPYNQDPVRFLVPLVPIFIIYAIQFYLFVFSLLNVNIAQKAIVIALCIGMIPVGARTLIETRKKISYGPFNNLSSELFHFLSAKIPKGEKVADIKPWAVAYFSGIETVPFESAYAAKFRILRIKPGLSGVFDQIPVGNEVFRNQGFVVIQQSTQSK